MSPVTDMALLPWPSCFLHQKSEDLGGDLRWSEPIDSVQVVVVLDRGVLFREPLG